MSKQAKTPRLIATNKKSWHDYSLEDQFEAGLILEGWEIKSLRAGQVQLRDSYVVLKKGEAWMIGAHVSPLSTVAKYITPDPLRSRKLLLNQRELAKLSRSVDRDGYTVVALDLHWKNNRAKLQIALAKGKKAHDKRQASKEHDWNREKQRLLKSR